MKFIGPLMWEHRLIEKMLRAVEKEVEKISETRQVDPILIDTVVDFIRIYADRTHHGKEEDILFRDLEKKPLSADHQRIMDELVQEHIYSRQTVGKIVAAKGKYVQGDTGALKEITAYLLELAAFYPRHIEKEDKHFFYPCLDYFSKQEQDAMLEEFWTFDRNMIHEKYRKVLEQFTGP